MHIIEIIRQGFVVFFFIPFQSVKTILKGLKRNSGSNYSSINYFLWIIILICIEVFACFWRLKIKIYVHRQSAENDKRTNPLLNRKHITKNKYRAQNSEEFPKKIMRFLGKFTMNFWVQVQNLDSNSQCVHCLNNRDISNIYLA